MKVSSKKFKMELPYDPVILFLGIYPKKMKTLIQKDMHINVPKSFTYDSHDMKVS